MRSLWRHRGILIQMAAEHVLHMQKALDQMNLQIHRVLNDITGVSGTEQQLQESFNGTQPLNSSEHSVNGRSAQWIAGPQGNFCSEV
jgi:hypothetical protein